MTTKITTIIVSRDKQNTPENRKKVQEFIDSRKWIKDGILPMPINPNGEAADKLVKILTDFNNDDTFRLELDEQEVASYINDNRYLSEFFVGQHLLDQFRLLRRFEEKDYDFRPVVNSDFDGVPSCFINNSDNMPAIAVEEKYSYLIHKKKGIIVIDRESLLNSQFYLDGNSPNASSSICNFRATIYRDRIEGCGYNREIRASYVSMMLGIHRNVALGVCVNNKYYKDQTDCGDLGIEIDLPFIKLSLEVRFPFTSKMRSFCYSACISYLLNGIFGYAYRFNMNPQRGRLFNFSAKRSQSF